MVKYDFDVASGTPTQIHLLRRLPFPTPRSTPVLAENPLLPNAELQALRAWTKRAQSYVSKQLRTNAKSTPASPPVIPGREALLAATLMQLLPGDTLVPEPDDTAALTLFEKPQSITALHHPLPNTHLLAAAALAAANKRAGNDKLVLAFTQTGLNNPAWPDALTWAQTEDLPLIIAIADPSGPDAFRPTATPDPTTLTWTSLQKLARKLKFPILSVDGEDAVAVYRVMQESVLRARAGAGPAILWAMLPTPESVAGKRPAAADPLRRLERYLKTRGISF